MREEGYKKGMITVIVPVYNVELYVEECLTSIVNQTYTDLKIIVVDDCSTDRSGELCDRFLADPRVIVIHKEKNEGLSCARNTGLQMLDTEYVTFVDSDDYLAPEHIRDLYECLLKYEADMVACDFRYVGHVNYESCSQLTYLEENTIGGREAMLMLNAGMFRPYAWNKLYKSRLFETIRFPEGKAYEDVYVMPELILACEKIAFNGKYSYCYRMRDGSITHDKRYEKDWQESLKLRYDRINRLGTLNDQEKQLYGQALINRKVRLLHELLYMNQGATGEEREVYKQEWARIRKLVKFADKRIWMPAKFPRLSVWLVRVKRRIV